jgi:hypothetical protein
MLVTCTATLASGEDFQDDPNYSAMPHSVVIRIHKGREEIAEIACVQRKLAKGENLVDLQFEPVGLRAQCPGFNARSSLSEIKNVGSLSYNYQRRYLSRYGQHLSHRAHDVAGFLRLDFAGRDYLYQPYATDEDPLYYLVYYSWY